MRQLDLLSFAAGLLNTPHSSDPLYSIQAKPHKHKPSVRWGLFYVCALGFVK
jgi:hypothetical protein